MPFFNFRLRSANAANAQANPQTESMEVVRKRAKHRLIGSAVLVLAAVVGFPLLFDTQPRPIALDIPIEIPSKNTVKPLVMPAKQDVASAATASTATVAPQSSLAPKEEIVAGKIGVSESVLPKFPSVAPVLPAQVAPKKEVKTELKQEPKPSEPKLDAKVQPKPEPKPQPKPEPKPEPKPASKIDDGARAKALLDGQPLSAPAALGQERLVVQVGAFAEEDKAKEVRQKLERAGLKTYTQVADTKDGKRIRVRVGPFASKAEADKAASKIKTLDLPAAILTL